MTLIAERPPEAADRAVHGHWEGDLIIGKDHKSAIGTVVERKTGYLILVHLTSGLNRVDAVHDGLIRKMVDLPNLLRRTLTWDQGIEMHRHKEVTIAADLAIYFCDPHSPWQRPTNENTHEREHQRSTVSILPQRHRPGRLLARRPRLRRLGNERPPTQTTRLPQTK